MDNQHKMIKGYRDLSQLEIDLINDIKKHSIDTQTLLIRVKETIATGRRNASNNPDEKARIDAAEPERWLAMARTNFQLAYMEAVRSVAQPTTF